MDSPVFPIGSVLQTHGGVFAVVKSCPPPENKYDPPLGSVQAVSTDKTGKTLYKNPVFPQNKSPWITIYPDNLAEIAIISTLSENHLYELISEIGRTYKHEG
jgi:hypothetical protein